MKCGCCRVKIDYRFYSSTVRARPHGLPTASHSGLLLYAKKEPPRKRSSISQVHTYFFRTFPHLHIHIHVQKHLCDTALNGFEGLSFKCSLCIMFFHNLLRICNTTEMEKNMISSLTDTILIEGL